MPQMGPDSGSSGAPALLLVFCIPGWCGNSCPGVSWAEVCPATQELETLRNKNLEGIILHINIYSDTRKHSFIDVAVTLLSLMLSFKSLFSPGFICLIITVS